MTSRLVAPDSCKWLDLLAFFARGLFTRVPKNSKKQDQISDVEKNTKKEDLAPHLTPHLSLSAARCPPISLLASRAEANLTIMGFNLPGNTGWRFKQLRQWGDARSIRLECSAKTDLRTGLRPIATQFSKFWIHTVRGRVFGDQIMSSTSS